jgi:hypothetical protein
MTKSRRHFSNVLVEAAQFRALRDICQSDPDAGPASAAAFLQYLASRREAAATQKINSADDDT